MSNKKRINERMVMLQKRSGRIEKARRDMMVKVIFSLGIQSAKSSRALQKFSDAIIRALPNNVDEFRGVFEEGSEKIVMGDGSKKQIFVNSFDYKKPLVNWNERPREIKNKHESYLEVMGLMPTPDNVIFTETTELDHSKLQKLMSISEKNEWISKAALIREWKKNNS
jgi:hypothetical protein